MELKETKLNCQLPALQNIQLGRDVMPKLSLIKRLKFILRRRLNPESERSFKNLSNHWTNSALNIFGTDKKPAVKYKIDSANKLKSGDHVRICSLSDITATLNHWRQLKGCTFMPEMGKYCGSIHIVHKRMERFVDERDFRVKRSKGIILLKDLFCEGTADFGSCDRSCYYFWREEWLEKIDAP